MLDHDPTGMLRLFAVAVRERPGGTTDADLSAFAWSDTAWALTWMGGHEPGFTHPLVPLTQDTVHRHLLWSELEQIEPLPTYPLLSAAWSADGLAVADTVLKPRGGSYDYAGAVSPNGRRWVIALWVASPQGLWLRVSDRFGEWRGGIIVPETPRAGNDGVALGALDDSTALVVWAGDNPTLFGWGVARDTVLTPQLYPHGPAGMHPVLRPDAEGTWWLALGMGIADSSVVVLRYRQDVWEPPDTLTCLHLVPGDWHETYNPTLSFDGHVVPTAAWRIAYYPLQTSVCVCFPTDSSYGECEELQTGGADGAPVVARDHNGDVWLAWWRRLTGTYWTHTYTRATCTTPTLAVGADRPSLRWLLSEPAPGSWWAVLRAEPGGEFEPVARVRAGAGIEMTWTDTSARVGEVLRYGIRRECLDQRYEWLSEEALWWPRIASVHLSMTGPHPVTGPFEVEVLGAPAGRVTLTLYDVQGRAVSREHTWVSGSGRDVLRVEAVAREEVHAGVYFVRARHANGRESNAVRLVVLR
jgi:hypothetical protein